jgi:hypothetical protein
MGDERIGVAAAICGTCLQALLAPPGEPSCTCDWPGRHPARPAAAAPPDPAPAPKDAATLARELAAILMERKAIRARVRDMTIDMLRLVHGWVESGELSAEDISDLAPLGRMAGIVHEAIDKRQPRA